MKLMGIVNATPDSFSDPGRHDPGELAERGRALAQAGAAVVDVGGESGRTDREPVPEAVEAARVVPVIERLAADGLTVSVDTWRAQVAREALEAGAAMVNDPSGLYEPEVADACAVHGAALVITHTRVPPKQKAFPAYDDVVADVVGTVTGLAERAVARGVRPDGVLIDPAHDFGKNTRHSLEVTRRLDELVSTGWPVLVSLSRKDFVGETLDLPPDDRLEGTLAATALSAWLGARVFRAHDVTATRRVLDTVAAIRGTRPPAVARRGLA